MRALICLFMVGFVAAAICFGAADEKAKKDSSTGDAKAAAAKAPKPADAGKAAADKAAADKPTPGKSTDNKAANQNGDANVPDEATETAEPTTKYPEDEEAILKAGVSFISAYAAHDARQVAAHFAPEAEFVDEDGQVFRGRDEIEASTAKVFKEHPKASVAIDVASLRFLSPVLAIESGITLCTLDENKAPHATRYTAIHTKTDGQWLVASVREHELHGQRLHGPRLHQLDWLVGNWVDEDEDSIVRFNCQMTESGNYLIRDFDVSVAGQKVLSGSQRTGWDPISDKLRAWTFDSDGGYFDGTWHRDGEKWVLTSVGVTADGQSAAGTAVFTLVDANTITWQAVDREIDGVRVEDSEEFTLVRTGPQPQQSGETAAK